MTTWTMEQVRQARGIYAAAVIDPIMLERARVDVMQAARRKMFRKMVEMARPFVIELNPADVRFHEEADPFGIKVTSWWEPHTQEVELRGGVRDGEILAFRDAPHGSLMVAVSTPIEYRCVGWSESDRRWVYGIR